jgi:hypothetical protein
MTTPRFLILTFTLTGALGCTGITDESPEDLADAENAVGACSTSATEVLLDDPNLDWDNSIIACKWRNENFVSQCWQWRSRFCSTSYDGRIPNDVIHKSRRVFVGANVTGWACSDADLRGSCQFLDSGQTYISGETEGFTMDVVSVQITNNLGTLQIEN